MNSAIEKTEDRRRKTEEEMLTQEGRKKKEEGNKPSAFCLLSSVFLVFIRPYVASDYADVLALWEQAKLRPFTPVEIERLLRSGGGALVAVQQSNAHYETADERVVGIVLWSHNGSIGILWRLAVDESVRGQGIATRLLDRAEQDIRAAGFSGVSLLTRVNNTVAKGMYARRGYRWNDHLEFWGKKLPEPSEASEASETSKTAGSEAVGIGNAASEDGKTAQEAGGQGQC